MTRSVVLTMLFARAAAALSGQPATPAFEVASVRQSPPAPVGLRRPSIRWK